MALRKSKTALQLGAVVLFILSLGGCQSPVLQSLGIQLRLEQHTLSNGLKIVFVEDHSVPMISYQTWFRVGSVDENYGTTGLAHLFEHLMFKGTAKYGPKQYFLQLEAKGAEVNAATTRDYTFFYQSFVPSLLEKVVDLESDRMRNLIINEQSTQSEKAVVLEERRLRTENNPEGKMQEALWELAYRAHPYQWPVIGYPQDLLRTGVEEIREFYDRHYQPSNATLVIVGDFNPEATLALLKTYYGKISSAPAPKREIRNEPQQNEERRLVLRESVAAESFAQAYHVTSAQDDQSYALDVLASVLFDGTSSRANRKLVEDKKIMLGISGAAFTPTYPGLFVITGMMKRGFHAEEAEKELEALIHAAQEELVSEDEIEVAVRQLTMQLVDSVRTPQGLGQLIGTVQTVFGDPRRFAEDLSKYFKVTASDVRRVAQKFLIPNNRSVVTLVPVPEVKKK